MKREILFKGKLLHSGQWIEGNLIIAQNGLPYIIPFDVFDSYEFGLVIDLSYDCPSLVVKKSVSQYINQKDKNGKKIFEGDYDRSGNCVVWCSRCNGFEFAQLDVSTKDICISCHRCDGNFFFGDIIGGFEIVGNVAD